MRVPVLVQDDGGLHRTVTTGWSMHGVRPTRAAVDSAAVALDSALGDDVVVDLGDGLRDVAPGERPPNACQPVLAEGVPAVRVRQQPGEAVGEGIWVARRHEEAGLAVADRVLDATDVRADHRRAARHRLERRDAERLVPGRGNEDVGGRVVVGAAPPGRAAR